MFSVGRQQVAGKRDDAGERERMRGIAHELGGELAGAFVPAEQRGPALQADAERGTRQTNIRQCAPKGEQGDDAETRDDREESRDGRIEFHHKRYAEVGGEPERRALENRAEVLVAAQEQAAVVEAELRKCADEQGDAEQEQRQVARKRGIGDGEAEAGKRRRVAQRIAEREAGESDERVTGEEGEGHERLAEAIGGGARHELASCYHGEEGGLSRNSMSSGEGSQPFWGKRNASGPVARAFSCTSNKSTGTGRSRLRMSTG